MEKSWIYRSIFGDDPVSPSAPPAIPIIDDPRDPRSGTKRSEATDRLIRHLETERAIKTIFDDEMLSLVKNPADSPGEPSTTTFNSPTHFNLPEPTPDPRKPACSCYCQFCRSSDCKNCDASPRCEFSSLSVLDELLPVDEKTEAEFSQAALSRQQNRLRKARVEKHRRGLEPLIRDFKASLWPYGARISSELFERVADSMAQYVVDVTATV